MKASEFKTYLYRSRAKVELLYQQVQRPQPKTAIKWKIDLKILSVESGERVRLISATNRSWTR